MFEFVKNDISYLRIEILLFQFIKSGRRFLRGTTATPYHVYIQSKIPSVPLQVVVDVVVVDVVVVVVVVAVVVVVVVVVVVEYSSLYSSRCETAIRRLHWLHPRAIEVI